jgi:hypothetical protein
MEKDNIKRVLHIMSNDQSIIYHLLPEEVLAWLNKIGRVDVPDFMVDNLYEKEENSEVSKKEYSKELNKEVFRSLIDRDYSVLDLIYKSLKYPNFSCIIDLFEFCSKNEIEIVFERFDYSEGL